MDQFLDCVVVERIYTNRVGSQLVFRTNMRMHASSSVTSDTARINLLPLSGTSELKYRECLDIRQQIMGAVEYIRYK